MLGAQVTLQEGFEAWPPPGWTLAALGAGQGFIHDWQGVAHEGSHSAYAAINNSDCDHWMVAPPVAVASDDYELRFWEVNADEQFYVTRSVWISTGSGTPGSADFELLATWADVPTQWTERVVNLADYAGQEIHLAWRYEGTWHTWFVDEVSVSPSELVDVALVEWQSPDLVVDAGPVDVIVAAKNWGTSSLSNAAIQWSVNGVEQPEWSSSMLDWQPNALESFNLGVWDPAQSGFFTLSASIVVDGDFDDSNNHLELSTDVSSQKSVDIVAMVPVGMQPEVPNQPVRVLLANTGVHTVDTLLVAFELDGSLAASVLIEDAGLVPGETAWFDLEEVSLAPGLHALTVQVHALGDPTWPEDVTSQQVAVNTFWESFEGGTLNGMPEGWETVFGIVEGTNFDQPYHGEWYYTAMPDANAFGEVTDTLWLHPMTIQAGDELSFWMKKEAFLATTNVMVVEDVPSGEVTTLGPVNAPPGSYQEVSLELSSLAGIKRIGITSDVVDFPGLCRFDYFQSTASPFWWEKDLKASPNVPDYRIEVNEPWEMQFLLQNVGMSDIAGTDYSLELIRATSGEVVASMPGLDCASWEEVVVPLQHIWTEVEAFDLAVRIAMAEDQNLANNLSQPTTVHVVPSTTTLVGEQELWESMPSLNVPFNANGNMMSLGEDDVSQMHLSASELGGGGTLYGLALRHQSLLETNWVASLPLQIRVAPSSFPDLSTGWLPPEMFETVYDDTVHVHHGFDEWVYLPFDSAFAYSGVEALVFQFYQHNPSWPPALFRGFYVEGPDDGVVRSRVALDVYNLDIDEALDFGFPLPGRADVRLIHDVASVVATLEGTVLDAASGDPLPGVEVVLAGSSLTAQTGTDGAFSFGELPLGNYGLEVGHWGYVPQSWEGELALGGEVVELALDPLPTLAVSGQVVSNEFPTTGLSNVDVTLQGAGGAWYGLTDAEGMFAFSSVYGQTALMLTGSKQGFEEGQWEFWLDGVQDTVLSPVALVRDRLSPFDPVLDTLEDWRLLWKDPQVGQPTYRTWDNDAISTSYTNEPFEDVWLGNAMELGDDTTTVLALEFQFDIYDLSEDWVTAEVLDAEGSVLTQSEPFVAIADTVLIVPVPQVALSGSCYAMLHWQNNASNVNALAMDFSSEDIPNVACIAYPDLAPQLFTDFVGGGPNSAFHVRVHTYDDTASWGEEIVGYEVVRGEAESFPETTNWDQVEVTPLNSLFAVDEGVYDLESEVVYRYAVRALYPSGESAWTFGPLFERPEPDAVRPATLPAMSRLYPNPAASTSVVVLEGWPVERVDVFDASGVCVKSELWNAGQWRVGTLSLQGLSPGAYEVRGIAGREVLRSRLVIQ